MEFISLSVPARPDKRLLAFVIDFMIIALFVLPVQLYQNIAGVAESMGFSLPLIVFLYKMLIYVLLDVIVPYNSSGKTIGRYFTRIHLIRQNGRTVTFGRYLRRSLLFIVLIAIHDLVGLDSITYVAWVFLGVFTLVMLIQDEHRLTPLEYLSGTMVVQDIHIHCRKEGS